MLLVRLICGLSCLAGFSAFIQIEKQITVVHHMNQSISVPIPTKADIPGIYWLHIEKTGTSFGMVLFLYACPIVLDMVPLIEGTLWEESDGKKPFSAHNLMKKKQCSTPLFLGRNQDFGWHLPYHNEVKGMNHSVMTFFRHPIKRIVSAFLFDRGGMLPPGFARDRHSQLPPGWDRYRKIDEFKNYVLRQPVPILAYVDPLFIRSGMTKMVLGFSWAFNITLTEDELVEAKRRVIHDFAFIGLTEEYPASIELFHKQFGPSHPKAIPYESLHMRENTKATKQEKRELEKILRDANYKDRFDEEIYDLASKIFYSRCRFYNVSTIRSRRHAVLRSKRNKVSMI